MRYVSRTGSREARQLVQTYVRLEAMIMGSTILVVAMVVSVFMGLR